MGSSFSLEDRRRLSIIVDLGFGVKFDDISSELLTIVGFYDVLSPRVCFISKREFDP